MHVCFLSQEFYPIPGGAGRYVFELSKSLASLGHKVTIITKALNPSSKEKDTFSNVLVLRAKTSSSSLYLIEVPKILEKVKRAEHIDIIHSQIPFLSDLFVRKDKINCPIVETVHSLTVQEVRGLKYEPITNLSPYELRLFFAWPFLSLLEAKVIHRCDSVITISKSTAYETINFHHIHPSKLNLVYLGVDTHVFREYPESSEFIREKHRVNGPLLLYVGRLCARKNLITLLHAIKQVVKKYSSLKLLIVGGGGKNYKQYLIRLADILGIKDNVSFVGYVPDEILPFYYSACDIFLLSSWHESLGFVLLEAMSSAKPVIASNVGGVPEIVQNGVTGFTFNPNNHLELAQKIILLIEDSNLAKRIGKTARKYILNNHDWRKIARRTLSVYEKTIER